MSTKIVYRTDPRTGEKVPDPIATVEQELADAARRTRQAQGVPGSWPLRRGVRPPAFETQQG